jgi:putative glutathione S-transferase
MSAAAALPASAHLYISYTCPYAHRTLLARALLGLEKHVPLSITAPYKVESKWAFIAEGDKRFPEITTVDTVDASAKFIADIYQSVPLANWDKVNSVPYLVDSATKKGISNGSADIVDLFLKHPAAQEKLSSPHLAGLLTSADDESKDAFKLFFSNTKALYGGSAKTQEEYEEQVKTINKSFSALEEIFKKKKFLGGDRIAVQDILLFPFVFRWDYVYIHTSKYYFALKQQYPNVARFIDDFIAVDPEAVKSTVRFNYIEAGIKDIISVPFIPHFQHKF